MTSDASGALRIGVGGVGGIGVERVGVPRGRTIAEGGGIAYGDGAGGLQAFLFATDRGVEDLLVARDATAAVGYKLDLPDGWRLFAPPGYPGLVEVRDERDVSRVRIRTGKAWDASGREVAAVARVRGREVEWTVDENAAWPVLVDPTFEDAGSMIFERTHFTATLLPDATVLMAGGLDATASILASAEIYDLASGKFTATDGMTQGRRSHAATLLSDGTVLITGGADAELAALASAEVYDPATRKFTATGSPMVHARVLQSATLLPGGSEVLVVGGFDGSGILSAAEIYDTAKSRFSAVAARTEARAAHTATLLATGDVLIAGGSSVRSAELYNPAGRAFTATKGAMQQARAYHSATLLPDGKVLVAGGSDGGSQGLVTAEIYNPGDGKFEFTGSLADISVEHTATLLPDGRVLIAGGETFDTANTARAKTEVYDPQARIFKAEGAMAEPRTHHTVTLLPSGKVLIAGGARLAAPVSSSASASAEIYDPEGGTVVAKGCTTEARIGHTATRLRSGRVLIAGGPGSSADIYDPETREVTRTGSMVDERGAHSAALLPSGKVLMAGGQGGNNPALKSAEIYDPASGTFTATKSMTRSRVWHRATWLTHVAGSADLLLITGGNDSAGLPSNSAEIYDPGTGEPGTDKFAAAGEMNHARTRHTATELGDGTVFISGGQDEQGNYTSSTELYHPAGMSSLPYFSETDHMKQGRWAHTATLLLDGKVLITGGQGSVEAGDGGEKYLASAEVYDPGAYAFGALIDMIGARKFHTATLLETGEVLITGGFSAGQNPGAAEVYQAGPTPFHSTAPMARGKSYPTATPLSDNTVLIVATTIEVYHPDSHTFTSELTSSPPQHTITLLPTGKVLIAGGAHTDPVSPALTAAQLYDPVGRAFTTTALPMTTARVSHTATLMSTGQVLIAGGADSTTASATSTASAELYDPQADTFTPTGSMTEARSAHTATLLPSGKVLITGGVTGTGSARAATASAEFYDPERQTFTATASMTSARSAHAATLLPSGKVLIAGGGGSSSASAEIYDPTTGLFTPTAISFPAIASGTLPGGDALLASNGRATRVAGDGATQLTFQGVPDAFAVASLPNADSIIVGPQAMLWIRSATRAAGTPVGAPILRSAVRLASGELFGFQGGTYRADPRPRGVMKPAIIGAPPQIVAGGRAKLTGTRFSSPTAVGAASLPADPSHLPVVAFMPAAVGSGGPVFGRTVSWTDTELTWEVPRTVFLGPAFLYVYVEGVWSDGFYAVLAGEDQGRECKVDGECAKGHCAERVCCDKACAGGCETCRAKTQDPGGADGTCRPIRKETVPRFGCELVVKTDGGRDVCSPTGTCDGTGSCTAPQGTPCSSGLVSGSCFAGTCVSSCKSAADCGPGTRCSVDHRCIPSAMPAVATDSGACSVVRATRRQRGDRPPTFLLAATLATAALRRRREIRV
jgi:WD40 repeat protein